MTPQELASFVGKKFSMLEVLSVGRVKGQHAQAICRCDCGVEKTVRLLHVLRGSQVSCGCARGRKTHGMSRKLIYSIWRSMRGRCENHKNPEYRFYGGRGIAVCDRWSSFANFYADMGERPDGRSLDRINLDGNYEPTNCRWATRIEQQNNTSRNVPVQFNGQPMTLAEAIRLSGTTTPARTIYQRVFNGSDFNTAIRGASK